MVQVQYLVVGSSHAALEAIDAIRMHDQEGSLALVTRDDRLPYSPTVLPYIVSGRSAPDNVQLRQAEYFSQRGVSCTFGRALVRIEPKRNVATLSDGIEIAYDKLLLATGAAPALPPIPGIEAIPYHVLRTIDDALRLKAAIALARRAIVLGGGLIGMHAAENLVRAGVDVTIVEKEPYLLSAYFDATAGTIIERTFLERGARIMTGRSVIQATPHGCGARLQLNDGEILDADLLLLAVGARPDIGYLADTAVVYDAGIIVDDSMRTSVANIWAAGDCAQGRDFFSEGAVLNSILPDAAEQGRLAGMAMAGDSAIKSYAGAVPLNTYGFFGRHAISVGTTPAGAEELVRHDEPGGRYLRLVVKNRRLQGIFGVNEFFDGGIMRQLILRRVDVSDALDRLFGDPQTAGRELMSRLWR